MLRRLSLAVAASLALFSVTALRAEDQYFDAAGVRIHYAVQGTGEPVLLIHGFAVNIDRQWVRPGVLKALADDYRVVAIENRGHGKSDKPHDPKQYGSEMIEDPVRLLDHLKIKRAHVVGYSMGGYITAKLLATHPDRLVSATLGGAGWSDPHDTARMKLIDELAGSLEAGKGIGPLIYRLTPAGRPKPTDDQLKTINAMFALTNDQKALGAVVRSWPAFAVPEDKLKANKVPTLALVGDIDPLKTGVDALQGRLANLETVVIQGADHNTAPFRPEFTANLKTFLAKRSAKKPVAATAGKD